MRSGLTIRITLLAVIFFLSACGSSPDRRQEGSFAELPPDTSEGATAFIENVERELERLYAAAGRAAWVKATYITEDTTVMEAQAHEAVMAFISSRVHDARRYSDVGLPFDVQRKFDLLRLSLSLPAPSQQSLRAELAQIASRLEGQYGAGKYCRPRSDIPCQSLDELEEIIAENREPGVLLEAWLGWREVAAPMRNDFTRLVHLANQGAREIGFSDVGALWRSRYDMPPAAFEAEVERLWQQVKPLYQQLHCYVRSRLHSRYGDQVPLEGPIPAHLLGNMWSQEWANILELLVSRRVRLVDLEQTLRARKTTPQEMVRYAEAFFASLGMDVLPTTFWQRSMFVKPRDRDVVCHASAWTVDFADDLRLKMCIRLNDEDFATVHHELGHNYYQHYYRHQPPLFRDSANDAFHEGLGDTISLSVTPEYLMKVGLLNGLPKNLNENAWLLEKALGKVAFLPFGLLIDKWRWDVFSGKIQPDQYTAHWWKLRKQYQGIIPPLPRNDDEHFDPGAKYHIAANVPYVRYFLAHILQFQFHQALCDAAGHQGPLHRCSIYANKEAGKRLIAMMKLGQSRPWSEALKLIAGTEQIDAKALLAYFEPLSAWLTDQNKGQKCGW